MSVVSADTKPCCPMCGSVAIRKATVYWQCLTCGRDWLPFVRCDDGMPRCPECDGLTEHVVGCGRMDRC